MAHTCNSNYIKSDGLLLDDGKTVSGVYGLMTMNLSRVETMVDRYLD